jgi:hypothetical protein
MDILTLTRSQDLQLIALALSGSSRDRSRTIDTYFPHFQRNRRGRGVGSLVLVGRRRTPRPGLTMYRYARET